MKKFYLLINLLLLIGVVQAQDIQFSQFYANSMFINPAFTGGMHLPRVTAHYRGQWLNLDSRYNTYLFAADIFSSKQNSGFGIMALRDVQGGNTLSTTDISLMYSYELKLTKEWTFRAGGQGTAVSRYLDYSQLRFPSQFDDNGLQSATGASHGIGQERINYLDVSFGGLVYNKLMWFGVSGHHLNQPNQSFIQDGKSILPMSFSFISGYKILFSKHDGRQHNNIEKSITPTVHYKTQNKADQLDFGVYGHYNKLLTGVWYRGIPFKKLRPNIQNNESMAFMIGVRTNNMVIRYSYDAVVSTLTEANPRGAHEIGITLVNIFHRGHKKGPARRLPCPNFI